MAAKSEDGVEMTPHGGSKIEAYHEVPIEEDRGIVRDAEEIRNMPYDVLRQELELILCDIVCRVGGELQAPVDVNKPLVLLGMDSMSVIQFKGVLDNRSFVAASCFRAVILIVVRCIDRYMCNIPDEYMFTNLATLDSVVKSVLHGEK